MKSYSSMLLLTTALTLAGCDAITQQWLTPDTSFANVEQPNVKGINDTQEEMAREAFAAGDYAKAAQFYQQLIASKKGEDTVQLRYKLGMAESTRRAGGNEAALAMYDELNKTTPMNVDVMEGRGLTLMALGKSADAGRVFAEVIERDGKRWRALNALGILFVTKNLIPEAMAYYGEALNQSPDNAAILNNIGLSQAVDHNFPKAKEALIQAARASKAPAQKKHIELNLAMVYGVSGDMERARELASKYLEGPALDNNMGLYAHLAKDDGLARTYLNMALTQSAMHYERAWQNLDVVGAEDRGGALVVPVTKPNGLPDPSLLQPKTATPVTAAPVVLPEVSADEAAPSRKPAQ